VVVINTLNIALWAFRPNAHSTSPAARRWSGGITVFWAIALPAVGAASVAIGGIALVVTGAVALACWPVVVVAFIKRRAWPPAQADAERLADADLTAVLDEQGAGEVGDLLAAGKNVPAIRRVRELTGLRLVDAKRLVDLLAARARPGC
jgi:hypothetical protein